MGGGDSPGGYSEDVDPEVELPSVDQHWVGQVPLAQCVAATSVSGTRRQGALKLPCVKLLPKGPRGMDGSESWWGAPPPLTCRTHWPLANCSGSARTAASREVGESTTITPRPPFVIDGFRIHHGAGPPPAGRAKRSVGSWSCGKMQPRTVRPTIQPPWRHGWLAPCS